MIDGADAGGDRGQRPLSVWTWAGLLSVVLAARALYLARYGGDQVWMNLVTWAEARSIALSEVPQVRGAPLIPLLFVGLRRLGLSPDAALWSLYLAAHAGLAVAVVGFARRLARDGAVRRTCWAAAVLLAVLFPWALDSGFRNIATTLSAAVLCLTIGLGWTVATGPGARWREGLTAAGVFLGAMSRSEAAFALGLLGAAALAAGPRLGPRARRLGLITLVSLTLSLGVSAALRHRWEGSPGLNSPRYSYYTFMDGVPWAMCWIHGGDCSSEHARYRFAAGLFGTADENGRSVARAMLRHPLLTAERMVAKLPELVWRVLLIPRGFGAPAVILAMVGLVILRRRRARGPPDRRGLLLWALATPVPVLLIPPPYVEYFLAPLVAALLLSAVGLEALLRRLSRWWAVLAGVWVAGLIFIGTWGYHEVTNSPAFTRAARWLERRCAGGCLVNALPQMIGARTWRRVDHGAPTRTLEELPIDQRTSPGFARRLPPALRRACSFSRRVQAALERGAPVPMYHVEVHARSLEPFNTFDTLRLCQGPAPPPAGWTEAARFEDGADAVIIRRPPISADQRVKNRSGLTRPGPHDQ